MPILHEILPRLNVLVERIRWGDDETLDRGQIAEMLGPGQDLVEAAVTLGVVKRDVEADFLRSFPTGIAEAMRGILLDCLSRDPLPSLTFAWAPGYDYELTIWDCPPTGVSTGGVTVLVRSRYPLDEHPSQLPVAE